MANQCSTTLFVLVSRVFAPAPGSESRTRIANMSVTTPFAKPQGRSTRVSRTCASPRLRQSLAALGFGYGLNEKQKTENQYPFLLLLPLCLRASVRATLPVFIPNPSCQPAAGAEPADLHRED